MGIGADLRELARLRRRYQMLEKWYLRMSLDGEEI